MPMKSQKQRSFLHAKKPAIAAKFEAATPKGAKLPMHVKAAAPAKPKDISMGDFMKPPKKPAM
jgi:hypothetical protein